MMLPRELLAGGRVVDAAVDDDRLDARDAADGRSLRAALTQQLLKLPVRISAVGTVTISGFRGVFSRTPE